MSEEFKPVYSGDFMQAEQVADLLEEAGIETRWIETSGDSLGSSLGYSDPGGQVVISVPVSQAERALDLLGEL